MSLCHTKLSKYLYIWHEATIIVHTVRLALRSCKTNFLIITKWHNQMKHTFLYFSLNAYYSEVQEFWILSLLLKMREQSQSKDHIETWQLMSKMTFSMLLTGANDGGFILMPPKLSFPPLIIWDPPLAFHQHGWC